MTSSPEPHHKPNIVLIGFMGSGKSSVGRALARQLHFQFSDTDHLVEETYGKPIHMIFLERGESFFRDLETKICSQLQAHTRTVISTGGGIVVSPKNRQYLQKSGFVVYLYAPLDRLLARLPNDGKRPLLRDLEAVRHRYTERQQWYEMLSDYTVDTSLKNINEVVSHLATLYHDRFSS